MRRYIVKSVFFFNDTATTEIYTLSLHDALPILDSFASGGAFQRKYDRRAASWCCVSAPGPSTRYRKCGDSSIAWVTKIGRAHAELQSRQYLVCRLLLEKTKRGERSRRHRVGDLL